MESHSSSSSTAQEKRQARTQAIRGFLAEFAPSANDDLLFQMIVNVCRLAADDADRGDLKVLNIAMKELRYAFKVFRPYADIPKVSMFGSARTPQDHPQYHQAKEFAQLIQERGWMVITGAGDGIMRAGHQGASRDASFGVAISLPFEQSTNTIIANDPKLVNFKYFFTRKVIFVKEAKAIVLFPGGFGTQDEGFESLTLIQTQKASPVPIIMIDEPGGTYWKNWLGFVKSELLRHHMIDKDDLNLFKITDSVEDAIEEIMTFYRRYHSSRYVDDRLVIRLNETISDDCLAAINDTYTDILTSGCFELSKGPLPKEDDELPDKVRLVFPFDRRNAGRLRSLIDYLNRAP